LRPATAFAPLVLVSAGPLAAQHSYSTRAGYLWREVPARRAV